MAFRDVKGDQSMKLIVYLDVTQVVGEEWEVEVSDGVNLKDFMAALEEDSSLLFNEDHPDILAYPKMMYSETFDDLSSVVSSVQIKKETK
jgi:hypothetical protein